MVTMIRSTILPYRSCRMLMLLSIVGYYYVLPDIVFVSAATGSFKPEVIIGINADTLKTNPFLGTFFEPAIKYTASGTIGSSDIGYEAGVTIKGEENGSIPYDIWGKLKKKFSSTGWTVASKVDTTSAKLELINVDTTIIGPTTEIKIKGQGNMEKRTGSISSVSVVQTIPGPLDGSVSVIPRYNFNTKQTDVSVSYNVQDTAVAIDTTAGLTKQKYTIQQQFGSVHAITPSITNTGIVDIEYSRLIGTTGLASILVQPNSGVSINYKEGSKWSASIDAPFTNGQFGNINTDSISVSLKRSVF